MFRPRRRIELTLCHDPGGEAEKQVPFALSREAFTEVGLSDLRVELVSYESGAPTGRADLHSRRLNLLKKNLNKVSDTRFPMLLRQLRS